MTRDPVGGNPELAKRSRVEESPLQRLGNRPEERFDPACLPWYQTCRSSSEYGDTTTSPNQKILLVDDDENLLGTVGDFLKFSGYDVISARNGEEALERLQAAIPDLLILDIRMPKMGGVQVLKALGSGEFGKAPPVLVFTARAEMEEFFEGVAVAGFLPKTCEPEQLLAETRRILAASASAAASEPLPDRPTRILLAEDDAADAESLLRTLEQAGYQVERVATGPLAVERAIVWKPDALLVKEVLSEMNGERAAALLAEMPSTRSIPVFLYHPSESPQEAESLMSKPGIANVIPTANTTDILQAVRAMLPARRPAHAGPP